MAREDWVDGEDVDAAEMNELGGEVNANTAALDGKQDIEADLTAIAALSPTDDDIIQRKAGAWTNRTPAQLRADLAIGAVSVLDLGVTGDGSTDDSAAINTAITTYAGLRSIRFPKGRYRIGSTHITLLTGTHITCDPGAVFEVNAVPGTGTSIQAIGTEGAKTNLDANALAGTQTVVLPTGAGAGFAVGDIIGFSSSDVLFVNPTTSNNMLPRELRRVESVSGDTIEIDAPLEYDYLTADTAKFFEITPVTDIVLSGMRFESGPGVTPGTTEGKALKLEKVANCRLKNVELHNMIGGVELRDSRDIYVNNMYGNRLPRLSTYAGYVIWAQGATTNVIINGLRGRENRHLFTTVPGADGADETTGPQHIQINGAIGYGSEDATASVFDTHEGSRHVHFNDCQAFGGHSGYLVRGEHSQLNNCRGVRASAQGARIGAAAQNVQIVGGEFAHNGLQGINIEAGGVNNRVEGARVHHNTLDGIAYSGSTDTVIQGCTLYENTDAALEDSTSTPAVRPVIQGCFAPASATQTISISDASTTAIIADCVFTGYGAANTGASNSQAGSMFTNITTDTGVVGEIVKLLDSNGANLLETTAVASAVNNLRLNNAVAGNYPSLEARGSDSNVSIGFFPKGNGKIRIWMATGQTPTIEAQGADTNHNLNLLPKGTGIVQAGGNPVGVKVAVPSTATSTGVLGQWAADSSFLYICTATDTWRRVGIASW